MLPRTQTSETRDEESLEDMIIILQKDYDKIEEIGSGAFGHVFKANHKLSKKQVAIKLLQNCFNSVYSARKIISEIQIMRKLT